MTFYRFGNDRILPKKVWLKKKSTKTKDYVVNYARYIHYTKKSFLMLYVGTYDFYENKKKNSFLFKMYIGKTS